MASGPSSIEAVGVDLGGTKMLVGVVDGDCQILHRSLVPSHGLRQDELLGTLETELRAAVEARPGVAAIGLGIPCTIDRERGIAINAVNLELADVPLRDLMSERLGLPVFIDNDANVAAIAEHRFGAGRGARNVVLLTIGTGIGGGLILEGKPYRGSTGAGAELGHVVVDIDGPPCQGTCPGNGCLEVVASGTALAREAELAAQEAPDSALGRALAEGAVIDGALVTGAALAGDETSRAVLATIGRRLGVGLAGLANIFEPDVIVLGGGVMAAGDLLAGPARDELASRALPPMNGTRVVLAELGTDAGMIGAATMAIAELSGGEA
jgi:glucokinase